MGIRFSKPAGNTTRMTVENESASSPSPPQRVISANPSPAQDGSISRQGLAIPTTNTNHTTSAPQFDLSPMNTTFSGGEHDESTVYEHGGSLSYTKVPPSRQTRAFSHDSSFSQIHPETKKEVFRHRSFGDMNAVQIVCDQLLEILRQAVATSEVIQDEETAISRESWIMEPYELIIRNKVRIEEHRRDSKSEITQKHLDMLLNFLESSQPGVWQTFDEVQAHKCQKISFKNLFLLYTPHTTVFKVDGDAWRAYMIEKSEVVVGVRTTVLRIHAWFLDFNISGDRLLPHRTMFEVSQFSSERPIKDLELLPEWLIESGNSPRQELIERGWKHWCYCKKPFHKEYRGKVWREAPYDTRLMVIVDYATSSRCAQPEVAMSDPDSTSSRCSECLGNSIGLFSFPYPAQGSRGSHVCINAVTATHFRFEYVSTENKAMLLFCPPKLWAFSLRFKTWKMVSHNDLHEVKSQEEPFDDELYMDQPRKQSLSGIVSSYLKSARSNRDINSRTRKVRGLNILLFGSSGTGKTFTAECLARKFAVPLYTMTTSDLGVEPIMFDRGLQETFTRATNWKAMVLLDDVDLYSKERTGYNHERAALLPTFLRHLEFSRCLCLISMISQTDVDPAFTSRIHFAVPFTDFDFARQKEIWLSFIQRLRQDEEDSTDNLSEFVNKTLKGLHQGVHTRMNARQIKNCIDVALVLARNEGPQAFVKPHHIETVLKLGKDFKDHIMQESGHMVDFKVNSLFKE